jgi:hypothetical protein
LGRVVCPIQALGARSVFHIEAAEVVLEAYILCSRIAPTLLHLRSEAKRT